jgi:hypothetical protein
VGHRIGSRAAQRAAWDTYLAVTSSLLPVLDLDLAVRDAAVNPRLGAVVVRLRRYAPLWGGHGPMLVSAGHSAIRLYRRGDWSDLTALLHAVADRLFMLSAGPPRPRQGRSNQRAP